MPAEADPRSSSELKSRRTDLFPRIAKPIEDRVVGIDDSTFEINDVNKGERTVEKSVVPVVTVLQLFLRRGLLNNQRGGAAESIEHREFNGRNGCLAKRARTPNVFPPGARSWYPANDTSPRLRAHSRS